MATSFKKKRVLIGLTGQSCEAGPGKKYATTFGAGLATSADGGDGGSWAQRLAETISIRDGHIVQLSFDAYGGTSMLAAITGMCFGAWSTAPKYAGSIVTSDSGLWSMYIGITGGSRTPTAGNAPLVGSSVFGSIVTGADSIPWRYLGPADASDVAGRVYRLEDGIGKFDPLGRLTAKSFAELANRKDNFDLCIGLCSYGQFDSTTGINTAAVWANAQISWADAMLAKGMDAVFLGASCYYPASDANYAAKITPGVDNALAFYAGQGNKQVYRGVNARTELGVLPPGTAAGIPGLITPGDIHPNDPALRVWNDKWYDRIKASGLI